MVSVLKEENVLVWIYFRGMFIFTHRSCKSEIKNENKKFCFVCVKERNQEISPASVKQVKYI